MDENTQEQQELARLALAEKLRRQARAVATEADGMARAEVLLAQAQAAVTEVNAAREARRAPGYSAHLEPQEGHAHATRLDMVKEALVNARFQAQTHAGPEGDPWREQVAKLTADDQALSEPLTRLTAEQMTGEQLKDALGLARNEVRQLTTMGRSIRALPKSKRAAAQEEYTRQMMVASARFHSINAEAHARGLIESTIKMPGVEPLPPEQPYPAWDSKEYNGERTSGGI